MLSSITKAFALAGTALVVLCTAPCAASTGLDVPLLTDAPVSNDPGAASWMPASNIFLGYDFTYRRAAAEATEVRIARDATSLDLLFIVKQREPLTSQQATNGANVLGDDYVAVYLYPQGAHGFAYSFAANPQGTRYQTSSENSSYSPQWTASARVTSDGYVVSMRIPFDIIRSGGSKLWKAQFVRSTVATNGLSVWTHSDEEHSATDPAFAGELRAVAGEDTVKRRPKARVQTYALGEATTRNNGGNTSRVGLDLSLPVTLTSSFVATLHPDYSNLEIDQQSIAPTAFPRQYAEVRPFFTESTSFFNENFSCNVNCPVMLNTPAIPSFSQGYAYEGTQGLFSFGAFDALTPGRSDDGEALDYMNKNSGSEFALTAQRDAVSMPGLVDNALALNGGYLNFKSHFGAFFNSGQDKQTGLPTSGYFELGGEYLTSTTAVTVDMQRIGQYFAPVDGYVGQTDLFGYEASANKTFNLSPNSAVHDVAVTTYYARYKNHLGAIAQTDATAQVSVDFRNLVTARVTSSNQGVGVSPLVNDSGSYELLPFDGNAIYLGYKSNTNTPSYVQYLSGPYYHGHLNAWSYVGTIPLKHKVNLTLEAYSNRYIPQANFELPTNQWLERASLDWQMSRDAEVLVGWRRIIGANLPNSFELPAWGLQQRCLQNPYLSGCDINASNVSLAYHFLAARNEFYVVYGGPNSLTTYPAFFVKWIRYIGASKGT